MLSRTAMNHYWLARYVERTDYVARLLDSAARMTALASTGVAAGNEWESLLVAAGCKEAFDAVYDGVTSERVIEFMTLDPDNPSSIASAMDQARANARVERAVLNADTWAAVNDTWLARDVVENARSGPDGLREIVDWVKSRAAAFRGAWEGTMLRRDSYQFIRLGLAIERADNTARLLDVKYHVLMPQHDPIGGGLDHAHWDSILRAATALRAYQHIYREAVKPRQVIDLLALNPEMPRSIRAAYDEIAGGLSALSTFYGGRTGESQRLAGSTHARLKYATVEEIFEFGLHEFLEDMVVRTDRIGAAIHDQYMA